MSMYNLDEAGVYRHIAFDLEKIEKGYTQGVIDFYNSLKNKKDPQVASIIKELNKRQTFEELILEIMQEDKFTARFFKEIYRNAYFKTLSEFNKRMRLDNENPAVKRTEFEFAFPSFTRYLMEFNYKNGGLVQETEYVFNNFIEPVASLGYFKHKNGSTIIPTLICCNVTYSGEYLTRFSKSMGKYMPLPIIDTLYEMYGSQVDEATRPDVVVENIVIEHENGLDRKTKDNAEKQIMNNLKNETDKMSPY